jgi:hypothetical protein
MTNTIIQWFALCKTSPLGITSRLLKVMGKTFVASCLLSAALLRPLQCERS